MQKKRSLFIILILFLILFSTSFVSASEYLTHDNAKEIMTLSVDSDTIDNDKLNNINLDSMVYLSDSTQDQVDDAQKTDEIENESCLTYNDKAPILGASNDDPILGAEIHANSQGWTTAGQVMEGIFRASPGDIIYLDGMTFTGNTGRPWWASNTLTGVTVYGGSYAGDTAKATFTGDGYVLNFGDTRLNGVRFENMNFRNSMFWFAGGSTMTDCVFNNLQCSQQGICLMGDGGARRQYTVTNTKFTNLHHIYDPDVAQGGYSEFDDGHGQLIAAFGIRMDHCYFENTSSTHHGGAICIADESRWGSQIVPSELYYTDFINVTSKWFAVYIHANFSDSGDVHIYSPEIVDHCNFINCTATEEYGAALGISHDDLIVRDSKFINNTGGQGAAIMIGGLTNKKGTIDDTAFNGRNTKGNNITILRCEFKNNVVSAHETAFPASPGSSGNAGAIYVFGNDTKILDSTFDRNVAGSGDGAAIYIVGQRTNITGCEFTNHECENGTVYILGDDTKIHDSTFTDNSAENGAAVYIEGKNTQITESKFNTNDATNGGAIYIDGDSSRLERNEFNQNTADNQGGAVFIEGDASWISQNTFTNNEAVPQDNSSSGTTGLGGAFYVKGDNTMSGENTFTHNKARNGSAIYTSGNNFNLYYDSFNENQAWSYLLIVTPEPKESYYNESDVNVTICHVGGDNIINAIHNTAGPDQIHFHGVTYKHSNGATVTTGADETPVAGAENSNNGAITYQDDRENLQLINITKIVCDETGEVILQQYKDYTNITGEVRVTLRKPLQKGHYTVYAEHPEDWNYKYIANIGLFEVLGLVDLSTEKTSDKTEYYVGETVTWTITVKNANNATRADNVILKDVLPSEVAFVSASATNGTYDSATNTWTINNLTNGSSATLTIVTTAIKDGNEVINNATVSCDDEDWNLSNNDDNATIKINPVADLSVVKDASVEKVRYGETITWTITVRNNGPSKAENAHVDDVIPNGLVDVTVVSVSKGSFAGSVWTIGDMDADDSETLVISTKVDITNDNITNTATVTSDTYDPNEDNNEDNDTVEVPPEADLSVVKVADVEKVHIGDTVTWTITVTNNGPDTAVDAFVEDVIPGELTYVGIVSVSEGSFDGSKWTIGNLTNGAVEILVINTTVTASNVNITNVALVNSSTYDPNETNNKDNDTVEVPPEADLSIVKVADVEKVHIGDTVTWTITVTNNGPDTAVDAFVEDVIPGELTYVGIVSVSEGSFDGSKWTMGNLTNGASEVLVIETTVVASNVNITNVALVNSSTYDPNETNNKDNDTVEVPPEADLSIVKVADVEKVHIGDVVTWTITVTNNGPDAAVDAFVEDVIPGELSGVTVVSVSKGSFVGSKWTIGNLTNGEVVKLVVKTIVAASNVNVTNVALVNSSTYDPNETNNKDNDTVEIPPEADLSVIKDADVERAHVGDVVTWTVTVTNNGPDAAVDAYVDDVIPGELTGVTVVSVSKGSFVGSKWTIGNLTNGEVVKLVVKTTVAASNVNITNVALVNSSTYDPNETNNKDNDTVEIVPQADLTVNKTVSEPEVHNGTVVYWTITVKNNGPDDAFNVTVTDAVPEGLINVVPYGDYEGFFKNNVWTIDKIANGESYKLVLKSEVNATNTTIVNNVTVTSDTYDPNETNNNGTNQTVVPPEADLEIIKTVSNVTAHKGDSISWTITVTNNGPDAAVNVIVNDVIPAGLIYNGVISVDDGSFDGKVWSVDEIASGKSLVLVINTTVDTTNATIPNVVNVTSDTYDPNETNNNATNSTVVPPEADLEVTITNNFEETNTTAHNGDTITWTITVTNHGPDTAVNSTLKDVLPDGVIYVSHSTPNGTYDNESAVWTIGDMPVGETVTLTIVTTANTTNATIYRNVSVSSDTYDPNLSNNFDNSSVVIPPEADLEIIKTVSNVTAHKGDCISWTITVTNNGPDAAVNVVVNDVIPVGLIYNGVISVDDGSFDGEVWSVDEIASGKSLVLVINTTVDTTNTTIPNVVNVTSDTYDPNETNNNATNSTVVPPEADLEIIKLVSNASAHKGDNITWTIVVINHGPDTAVNVRVNETIPDGLVLVTEFGKEVYDGSVWYAGDIASGENATLTFVTQISTTNVNITNVVNVTSDIYDPNETNNNASNSTEIPPEADLKIIKTVSNVTAHKGDSISWTITVTNNGPDAAVNVVVNDVIPVGLIYNGVISVDDGSFDGEVWSVDEIASGETLVLVINTTVDTTNTTIPNVVNVTSDTYDPNETNNNASNSTVIPPEADLEVIIVNNFEESGDVCHNGDTITWTITVTNHGPDTAVNSTLSDVLPDGVIYVSHSTPNGTYDNESAVWTIGDIPVGETVTLTIVTTANTTNDTVYRNVSVSSDTYDPNLSNNKDDSSVVIPPEADLEIVKTVSNVSAHKVDSISWTITVTNNGPDAAVNVVVNDVIPAGLIYNGVISVDDGSFDGEVWSVDEIASGKSLVLVINTTVDTTNTTIPNVVNVTSDTYDPNETNNNASNSTVVPPEADLEVIITNNFEESGDVCHNGDTITWTITVTNHGPDTAVNSTLSDVLPDGVIYVSHSTPNGTYDNESAVWTIGDIPVGETVTLTIVTTANTTNTTVNRDVNVSSDTYDPNMNNNKDDSSVVIPPEADLEIVKTVSNVSAHKGDSISWTITVTNNGPDAAVNVVVNDVIPAGLIYNGVISVDDGSFDGKVWSVDEIASGKTLVLVINTTVDTTNVTIPNVVNVTSDIYDPNETNNNASNSTEIPPEADLEVIIVNNFEESGDVCHNGDTITWTITVTNHGPDDAVNTTLSDVLPDGVIYVSHSTPNGTYDNESAVWTIGDIPVGETVTLTIVTKANATNTTVNRDVNVSSDTYDPDMSNNKDNSSVVIPPEADLQVNITNNFEENGTSAHNGEEVVWTITVTNNGPDDAINTILKDILPDGLIYVSDDSNGTYDNESAVWTIGDLPVGETVTLTIRTLVNASNVTITKDVSVKSDTYDPNLGNNYDNSSVDVIPEADLEIIKVVSNDAPHKGDKITWTIIVKNNGGDTAVNTVVTDKLPSGLVYVSDDSKGAYDHNTGIWTVGDLANGESATLNIVTVVDTTNATIVNLANTSSDTYDPNETNNECNKSTTVPPEVDLEITVVPNVDKVTVGDKVEFKVTVVNHGPDTAVNTRAHITIPDELKLLGFKPSKGSYDPDTGIWTIGDLAPGEEVTLILNTQALKSGKFTVEASVECDTYESDLSNNFDACEIDVIAPEPPADTPQNGVPAHPAMHATGNPIAMALLALLSIVGISLKRKS